MPVYNGSQYLKQSIESVLNQSFLDFEFVIIDDESRDNSLEIINSYAKKDPRIKIIRNKKNSGIQKSLNRGIAKSSGEYIARIDHDDIWRDKDKLRKQVDFLEKNPHHALVGTGVLCIDPDGRKINFLQYKISNQEIRNYILLSNQFAHSSVLIRKEALEKVGYYSEDKKYKNIEDHELWLRIGKKYKLANLPDDAVEYRISPMGISLKNQFRQRLAGLKLSVKYSGDYPNGFKAILTKLLTLPLSRSVTGSITKNSLFKKGYAKFTGIKR